MITLCGGKETVLSAWLPLLCLVGMWVVYVRLAQQQCRADRHWPIARTLAWTVGLGVLLIALWPPFAFRMHYDLRGHMVQHLLIGMVAPLGLILAAPVTLLLRTLPTRLARRVMRGLRSPTAQGLTHPVTAAVLNVGGMYLLYLTPLYAYSLTHDFVHLWLHVHFLVIGCLFTWAIVNPDPVPHRPRFSLRLGVLVVSVAAHGYLSKLMYAYDWPRDTLHPLEQIREAAQWMYYGGDVAEGLLMVALFAEWYRLRGRQFGRVL